MPLSFGDRSALLSVAAICDGGVTLPFAGAAGGSGAEPGPPGGRQCRGAHSRPGQRGQHRLRLGAQVSQPGVQGVRWGVQGVGRVVQGVRWGVQGVDKESGELVWSPAGEMPPPPPPSSFKLKNELSSSTVSSKTKADIATRLCIPLP